MPIDQDLLPSAQRLLPNAHCRPPIHHFAILPLRHPFPIRSLLLLLSTTLLPFLSIGQETERIELLHANALQYDKGRGEQVQRLIGDVRLKHKEAIMNCDSAYLYKGRNDLDAFGNVHIEQGDTIDLHGDSLFYRGDKGMARLRGNIRFIKGDMTLHTDRLTYDLEKNIARYKGGGRISDEGSENELSSERGTYFPETNDLFFKRNIELRNPDQQVFADTLQYNVELEKAFFHGPTTMRTDQKTLYCEDGWSETRSGLSLFKKNAWLSTPDGELHGDSIRYNEPKAVGEVFGNVRVKDTVNDALIRGQYARHDQKRQRSYVTGRPELIQTTGEDSLFLHADTLRTRLEPGPDSLRSIFAYPGVRFYRNDIQGQCDSLSYLEADSAYHLYGDPVLWSEENQLTGDTIRIHSWKGRIRQLIIRNTAFITSSAEDSGKFNQIRGQNMTGHFVDNDLRKVRVNGNGQTVYYAKEENGDKLIGANKAKSSNITIRVKENDIQEITLHKKPDATLTPIDQVNPAEMRLEGFRWAIEERPRSREDIFRGENEKTPYIRH